MTGVAEVAFTEQNNWLLDHVSYKFLLIFMLLGLLTGCRPNPENYRQEIVLEAIRAAERNNLIKLSALTKGAKVTPAVVPNHLQHFLFVKNEFQYCSLANLLGDEADNDLVQARWDCNTVQDHVVNFTFNGNRIIEIEAIPQE